ncbi:MAG: uridine kinase [Acidobacteria bacterium]|nr:uridine kinase [Acidobacteriota bacterium]
MATTIIGIGGPSGSGKSTLAAHLRNALAPARAEILTLDSYYFPLDHLTPGERSLRNFDHPDSLDWALIARHLAALLRGEAIDEPIYRFDLHTRDARTRRVEPAPYVLIEGILALHDPALRTLMHRKVYIDTQDPQCLTRRLRRDIAERGRTAESVEAQYEQTVRPMAEQFVWPSRQWADIAVSGERGYDEPVRAVLGLL